MIQSSTQVLQRRWTQRVSPWLVLFLVTGIGLDASAATIDFDFDFSLGDHDWTAGFSDYPMGDDAFYDLDSGIRPLPESAGGGSALFITGNNHSDDLFMYFTRQVSGLVPNTAYDIDMFFEFATEVPVGLVGVGGAPAESVTFKAGASMQQPMNRVVGGWWRLNVDKGNQSTGGEDMVVLGHIGKAANSQQGVFELVTRSSDDIPFSATTDASGSLWLMFGTDSGFEATTNLYYTQAQFTLSGPARLPGDINLDGTVDRRDAAEFVRHLGSLQRTWETGDFDLDGATTLLDLLQLKANLGATASPAASQATVPEPTTLTLAALGLIGCAARWRWRRLLLPHARE